MRSESVEMTRNDRRLKPGTRPKGRFSLTRREEGLRGRVFRWLSKHQDRRFSKEHHRMLATALAHLTRGWNEPQFRKPRPQLFIQALKSKNIKAVAEVGPGKNGVLLGMHDLFREAGVKMYIIGNVGNAADEYESHGIGIIHEPAGKLPADSPRFDLVLARNVFSIGGQRAMEPHDIIQDSTRGVIDLVGRLSTNPHAGIILTEHSDGLMVDRQKITPVARILRWHRWDTTGNDVEILAKTLARHGQREDARVMSEAPNVIAIGRKTYRRRPRH